MDTLERAAMEHELVLTLLKRRQDVGRLLQEARERHDPTEIGEAERLLKQWNRLLRGYGVTIQ